MTIAERIDPATAARLIALRATLEARAIEQIRAAAVRAKQPPPPAGPRHLGHDATTASNRPWPPGAARALTAQATSNPVPAALFIEPCSAPMAASPTP